jgi:quercetin dioxygenase-like cupin family protein
MDGDFAVVDPETVEEEQFNTCDVAVRKLTDPLGCAEMRVNQVVLEPGEVVTPHAHDGQEEVFVALTGGEIAVADDVHEVPAGGVVRVAPDVVRNLRNDSDGEQRWLAVGAPPVGTVEGFGAYVLPDGE